jgi:hypothetical protein
MAGGMSASQRRKGQSGEREVCALLQSEFGIKVGRKLGQARDSGNDVDIGPFCVEVKRRARIGNVYDWMHQAEFATPDGYHMPTVFMRADGQDWLVLMRFIDWAKLAREEICITLSSSQSGCGQSSSEFLPASPPAGEPAAS